MVKWDITRIIKVDWKRRMVNTILSKTSGHGNLQRHVLSQEDEWYVGCIYRYSKKYPAIQYREVALTVKWTN